MAKIKGKFNSMIQNGRENIVTFQGLRKLVTSKNEY